MKEITRLLAIDVGGTELKYGIIDNNYNISSKGYIKVPNDTVEDFLDAIYNLFLKFDNIDAIVVSMPGFVNSDNGMHLGGGHFHSLKDIQIQKLIIDKCNCDCFIENDGKSATIAEYYLGNLKDTTNSSVFIIGTGVGGGLIINGQLLKGINYTAGEYSYLDIDVNDNNPRVSTLSEYCSTRALLKMYKDSSPSKEIIDGREFFKRYHAGDLDAINVLNQFAEYVAKEIMNLGILLNVEKVVIGGGISSQDILLIKIKEKLEDLDMLKIYPETNLFKPEVVKCKYENDANLIGVAYEYLQRKEDKNDI